MHERRRCPGQRCDTQHEQVKGAGDQVRNDERNASNGPPPVFFHRTSPCNAAPPRVERSTSVCHKCRGALSCEPDYFPRWFSGGSVLSHAIIRSATSCQL